MSPLFFGLRLQDFEDKLLLPQTGGTCHSQIFSDPG